MGILGLGSLASDLGLGRPGFGCGEGSLALNLQLGISGLVISGSGNPAEDTGGIGPSISWSPPLEIWSKNLSRQA